MRRTDYQVRCAVSYNLTRASEALVDERRLSRTTLTEAASLNYGLALGWYLAAWQLARWAERPELVPWDSFAAWAETVPSQQEAA